MARLVPVVFAVWLFALAEQGPHSRTITLGGRQVQLYLVVHHLSRSPQQFQLLVKREKLPEIGAERSIPDQRTEPLD